MAKLTEAQKKELKERAEERRKEYAETSLDNVFSKSEAGEREMSRAFKSVYVGLRKALVVIKAKKEEGLDIVSVLKQCNKAIHKANDIISPYIDYLDGNDEEDGEEE